MNDSIDFIIQNHPLLPLLTLLLETLSSNKLDYILVKQISLELVRVPSVSSVDCKEDYKLVDFSIKNMTNSLLQQLYQHLQNLLTAEEAFRILVAANEPFKKTRRRLPPIAESELMKWLEENSDHPYMREEEVEKFCENYEGVENDQVRIFLTNARRKMSEGVRKRKQPAKK